MNAFPPRDGWPADPAAAEWAHRLGLKKRGTRDDSGPCPLCGGRDRFHVTERQGRALIGCRGCTHWRNAVRSLLILELAEATGLQTAEGDKAKGYHLHHDKANYSSLSRPLWLRRHWQEGKAAQDSDPAQLAWLATTEEESACAYEVAQGRKIEAKAAKGGQGEEGSGEP